MALSRTPTKPIARLDDAVRHCSCWDEFKQRFADLSDKQKGDLFEELTRAYLLLDPEYATKLHQVWLLREVPSTVRDRLKLPDADQGIDLVAETRDGEFWAIQCKYRDDSTHSLSWRELSTFTGLSFGVCRGISFGLICSTTERVTHVLKKQDRIGFCALDVWQGLDAEFFDRLRASLTHKPVRFHPLTPRPHQLAAIEDAHAHFVTQQEKRGKLIMPCGTGKSLTAYWIAQKLGARRILVAVPSLSLIRQTLKVWLRESMANQQAVEWICVCSDESAGHVERDDVAVLRQDLGVPCLTAPDEIADWLDKTNNHGLTVVFTTYQSGEAIAAAARQANVSFDLGIMDEAHKTVGVRDKLFSHLLHDQNLPVARRVFMTATERRYQGKGDQILSMDDPETYGNTFHLLTFKRALEYTPPILSDYKIITMLVSRDEVADLIRQNLFVRPDNGPWDREIEAEMLASLVALRKAMHKLPIRHAVSFHSSIRRAELFKAHNDAFNSAFPDYGSVATFHVSGQTPTGTRARIVTEFAKTERALITNARCLTEGVDVPGIDCVMFADPRRSAVDIVQAIGRALRPAAGKELGYVIVPILHDADAASAEIADSAEFQEILTTLRALAANDDRIIEYFRAVSQGRQRPIGGGSVEFDLDERLVQHIDLAQFVQEIDLKCWDRLAKLSWRPFEEAREFARSLKLRNLFEWRAFTKGEMPHLYPLPADIPADPQQTYSDSGWINWGDWMGTGTTSTHLREYRTFEDARDFARKLKLKSGAEWRSFCSGKMAQKGQLPEDIPAAPHSVFIDSGWKSMGDWLGTETIAPNLRIYRPFDDARAFAHQLKLKSGSEWFAYCKGKTSHKERRPDDIPVDPHQTYLDKGWKSWGDWLGTSSVASQLRKYRLFEEARNFARKLNLKSGAEWRAFAKGRMPHLGSLPADIPAKPYRTYADKGWQGMGDWLGTGNVAPQLRKFLPFDDARELVHKLKIKNNREWRAFTKGDMPHLGKLPVDIPAAPHLVYADQGWNGYGDWFGTGSIANFLKEYRSFEEARAFARKLNLTSSVKWFAFTKGHMPELGQLPKDIPVDPGQTYADKGWKGFGDWLGTGMIASRFRKYRPFEEARNFVHKLELKSGTEWRAFCKGKMPHVGQLPLDIPAKPERVYAKKGWNGMSDWVGTKEIVRCRKYFRPFEDARVFAHSLQLKSRKEWSDFTQGRMPNIGSLPIDIPAKPDNAYANKGWKGMGDWLGTGNVAPQLRKYRSFEKARDFARKLKLKSQTEWCAFCNGKFTHKGKLPADIPAKPGLVYADNGWIGYGDWLGTGTVAPQLRAYRPFEEARDFVRKLKLQKQLEWVAFCKGKIPQIGKLPIDIPATPARIYANKGWKGMGDWLGTSRTRRKAKNNKMVGLPKKEIG